MLAENQQLPKAEIIRKHGDFLRIMDGGKQWRGSVIHVFYQPWTVRQVGFSAPKRFGQAVWRNRAKRWMREVYRRHRDVIGSFRMIIMARPAISKDGYRSVEAEFTQFLPRVR